MSYKGRAHKFADDINTDDIIAAKYLQTTDKAELASHCMEHIDKGFMKKVRPGDIMVAGRNFGCGSSREHAPVALNIAGIEAVVAESYARIFYRNSVDGGFVAPFETSEHLYREIRTGDDLTLDTQACTLENTTQRKTYALRPLGDIEAILRAGGVFNYARETGMIETK